MESPDQPRDADLAAMLAEGRPEAFALLVERYAPHLLAVAERILDDREDALDVVQEALLRAHEEIAALRKPSRLAAWLAAITGNLAWDRLRRRRHRPLIFQMGAHTEVLEEAASLQSSNPSPSERIELRELRTEVRRSLKALQDEYAQIVRMFYLRGMTVRQIADELGIPRGTVKWRLSRARMLLRKELIMSEVTDGQRNECETQPLLEVKNICGHSGQNAELRPWEVCKTLLAQQVLFCVRKEPKGPDDIARDVRADVDYIRDHLARMTEAEVLEEDAGTYRANCILLDQDDVGLLRQKLGERGDHVASVVRSHEAALSEAIRQTSPCGAGFEEGHLRWIVLPTMVLNFGVSRRLEQVKHVEVRPPARPDGGRWFFWPSLIEGKLPSELGCNVTLGANGHAQYWSDEYGVPITRISSEQSFLLHRLAGGPISRQSLVDVFSEQTVASMVEKDLVRPEGGDVAAAVPIFHPRDGDLLQPVLNRVISAIVEEVYDEYPEDIYRLLDGLGFEFARQDYAAHAQCLAQMGVVPAMVRQGVLAAPPSPVPNGWGFFAWTGVFSPMEPTL